MTDYTELVKALRCKRDDCEGCDLAFFDKDEGWMCQYAAKDDDAAAAIEALQAEVNEAMRHNTDLLNMKEMTKEEEDEILEYIRTIPVRPLEPMLIEQLPKRGKWELIDGAEPMRWGCSRCKYLSWETSNYCPRCGVKMEVQE